MIWCKTSEFSQRADHTGSARLYFLKFKGEKMAEQINPFKMAQEQFDHVAKLLKLDSAVSEVLRWPMREYSFRIPVRMDNGSTRIFQGFRVQHNDARGPEQRRHPLRS